jgi:dihydrofolate reductase
MRKLFLHINVSLDGFIEDQHRQIDWHFMDDEFEEYVNNMLRSIDAMLFGRVAYELLASYWPTAAENPAAAVNPENPERHIEAAFMMNKLPKYVVSKTLRTTEWNNSHIINGNIAEEIAKLKAEPGKDIALFAGASLVSTFMKLNLIDEYRLIINPVLLGKGTRLFNGEYEKSNLELLDVKKFGNGALVLSYKAALTQ